MSIRRRRSARSPDAIDPGHAIGLPKRRLDGGIVEGADNPLRAGLLAAPQVSRLSSISSHFRRTRVTISPARSHALIGLAACCSFAWVLERPA